jgi:hypothetical protein
MRAEIARQLRTAAWLHEHAGNRRVAWVLDRLAALFAAETD